MAKETVSRIGVSLPPKLLKRFDSFIDEMGYANRSEAIRDAVREYILKNELKGEKGNRVGVISIIYDHDVHGVNDVLIDLQHKFHDVIQSSTHLHLDHHNCLELILVKGEAGKINKIKNRLTSVPGVRHSDMLITGTVNY
ncbi:MAG: nickel-responsive transcriptional regulator NikR [Candidatus Altiarchaeota archaeon]|nr:nickel-responsive transcriptional regulator NikR [Candidatus Altiarchaeota archaeon]MBU4437799.1 nickel-responsive transcriptional regulator NikR [Candidatus Altiarchaeota archaeon]